MPASDQKSPALPENDTKMPANEKIPAKNNKRVNWPCYTTAKQLIADPNFSKDVEQYPYPSFHGISVVLQVKNEFMREILQRSKNEF